MSTLHPLKRKSVKPSISTVRGMLPGKQFRALDAAMQSLRTAGCRLEWAWKNADIGWVCVGLFDDNSVCELWPTEEPLVGVVILTKDQVEMVKESDIFPSKYKKILDVPVETKGKKQTYEFVLEDSKYRDLFSNFIESLEPFFTAPKN